MTEQAAEVQTQTSAEPSAQQESQTPSFQVPEAYQDRGWAKTIDSEENLWKSFDETQKMIGKKSIPDQDAPDEVWDDFYKQLGKPEDPSAYELREDFEGLPEGVDLGEYKTKAAEMAHKMGLTPKQASVMWDSYMQMELESAEGMKAESAEKEAALDKEFDELGGKLFGDQLDEYNKRAQEYLKTNLPPELEGVAESIADKPKAMMAMIHLTNETQKQIADIKKQYGAEDALASGQQSGGMTQQDVLAKIRETKQVITDAPVFSKERKGAEEELNRLRGLLK